MIQQIQATQQPVKLKPEVTSDETQKTGSFQSLLQAASQKAAPADPVDSVKNAPSGKGNRPKDQKDPLKDAVALVQPNNLAVVALPQQAQPKMAATLSALSASLPTDSGEAQKQAIPALTKDSVSQLISTADASKAKPVQQEIPTQAKTVLQPEAQLSQPTAQPLQPTAAKPVQEENAARPLAFQQNVAQKPAADEAGQQQTLRTDGSSVAAVTESLPAAQTKQSPEVHPTQIAAEESKVDNVPVKVISQTAQANTGKKEDASSPDASTAAHLSDLYTGDRVVIKVSNDSVAEKVPAARQISEAVVQGLKNGKQQLQVDLYPQSLGKVSVKLVSEGGMLTVELAASNPKTQSLLASNSDEIRSMLQNTTDHNSVQVAVPNQPAQQQQQYAQQQNGYAEQNARQQRQEQQSRWYSSAAAGNISTDDFLSILKQTGISA